MGRCARLTLLLVLAGVACVGPAQERFARVRPGHTTRQEVLELLGEPTISTPQQSVYLGRDVRQVVVRFDQHDVVTEALWWSPPEPPSESVAVGEQTD